MYQMNQYLTKETNESVQEFKFRLYNEKVNGTLDITWAEVADILYAETGLDKTSDGCRLEWNRMKKQLNNDTAQEEVTVDELKDLILEYRKERYKLSDVSTQNNAAVRRMAREDTIKEIASEYADKMTSKKLLAVPSKCYTTGSDENEAILELSDWHYGIEVDTFLNKFDVDVCKQRVAKLRDETIAFCRLFKVNTLHVVNLGDLICGRIHQALRLQSRIDVITQIMDVAEILAEFISDITLAHIHVNYYDCFDNHSRLEPVKMDSLELESLVRIIPWYLASRLKKNNSFEIQDNIYDGDIISFNVMGYRVGGVHGHKDKPGQVVDRLTLLTKEKFDMVLTAHLHHFSGDEKNEVIVVSNGSLMGSDYYARDLRLSAKPSQNLILVNRKSVADYIHRVVL